MTGYIGEIRIFAGNFAPAGWAFCDGTAMAISENDTLFNLIGTTYGGDGQNTFNLPDLRGRIPLHMGNGGVSTYQIGESGGVESVTLNTQQIPAHNHPFAASTPAGTFRSPQGNVLAQSTDLKEYIGEIPDTALASNMVGPVGGNQPHDNLQPYLGINFIISLYGIYPSPS